MPTDLFDEFDEWEKEKQSVDESCFEEEYLQTKIRKQEYLLTPQKTQKEVESKGTKNTVKLRKMIEEVESKEKEKKNQEKRKLEYLSCLFENAEKSKKKQEVKAKENSKIKAVEEEKECTFVPKKISKYKARASSLVSKSLYERSSIIIKKKEETIKKQVKERKKKIMKECPFRPNLNKSMRAYTPEDMDVSANKYIKRMKRAQNEREEIKKIKELDYCKLYDERREKKMAKTNEFATFSPTEETKREVNVEEVRKTLREQLMKMELNLE